MAAPLTKAICFIACHGGPADHFAHFINSLPASVGPIEVYASGPALDTFKKHGVEVVFPFSVDKLSPEEEDVLAERIAKTCSAARIVITDVGHKFDIKIQKALQSHNVVRWAYYDNPENLVPGGYSEVAAQVMLASQGVLFANSTLVNAPLFQEKGKEIDLGNRAQVGIGYYPLERAAALKKQRKKEQLNLRQQLFERNAIPDKEQAVLVYFGGNNKEYFLEAFPAFLSLLEKGAKEMDLSHYMIVMQQHPGAKKDNLDGEMLATWMKTQEKAAHAPLIVKSDFSSEDAQVFAEAALYFQTSMGPQFLLAGIPTMQIGHEINPDILVRNNFCPSVTTLEEFKSAMANLASQKKEVSQSTIYDGLGIHENYLQILENTLKSGA